MTREEIELSVDICAMVDSLPENLRRAVVLFSIGYTQREIAEVTGVDHRTVGRRLEKAFGLMKNAPKVVRNS